MALWAQMLMNPNRRRKCRRESRVSYMYILVEATQRRGANDPQNHASQSPHPRCYPLKIQRLSGLGGYALFLGFVCVLVLGLVCVLVPKRDTFL